MDSTIFWKLSFLIIILLSLPLKDRHIAKIAKWRIYSNVIFLQPTARKRIVLGKNRAQKLACPRCAGFGAVQPENDCVLCSPGCGALSDDSSLPGHFLAHCWSLQLNGAVFSYLGATCWEVFIAHMPT